MPLGDTPTLAPDLGVAPSFPVLEAGRLYSQSDTSSQIVKEKTALGAVV